MTTLTRLDTNSLAHLNRALIGFDRIFNDYENRYANSTTNYPPYNVLKHSDDSFEVEVAVAGFDKSDISIEVDQDQLVIKGNSSKDETGIEYLHRGLAARNFERAFTLADHIEVGDAEIINGILRIQLTRIIPESLKPRQIQIKD
jgi:molecular chaperone IbpA